MFIIGAISAAMVVSSISGITGLVKSSKLAKVKRITHIYTQQCNCEIMVRVRLFEAKQDNDYIISMKAQLPYGMSLERFESHVPGLELATNMSIQSKHLYGRVVMLRFGSYPFYEKMDYDGFATDELSVPLYSPFGEVFINFSDETSCHLLTGGMTRMGKTVFLRLLIVHLLRNTKGNIEFLVIDNKVTDVYIFQNIPQIKIAETNGEAHLYLNDLIGTIEARKQRLKEKGDVIDAKEFRKKYPDEPMHPIFVVIDEYGRFAEDEDFQAKVMYLAETSGYLDVHLVVGTQRPDATSAIKPRIKANLSTRLSFSTIDEANSKLIIGTDAAANLGKIRGRCILLDGVLTKAQVPFIDTFEAQKYLTKFYKESTEYVVDGQGQSVDPASTEIPSFVERPDREIDLPGGGTPPRNRKSNRKKADT